FGAVLADLGVSSLQLDAPERGFGIRSPERLDMRMGDGCPEDALQLIERLDETALAEVIWRYGEERLSRRIARVLKQAVAAGTTSALGCAEAIRAGVRGHQPRHPALRTFQALRIAVNDELGQLEHLLARLPRLLRPGGVGVIISFHSLEDRLVKQAFRGARQAGIYQTISKKVVTAGADERRRNRRAQPAKLRWARLHEEHAA
ncbi:MAG: 16S rRNA (cytosine(1402)-N(4))-methyltransferase RsmH, partial [Planctomycetota bacterium]